MAKTRNVETMAAAAGGFQAAPAVGVEQRAEEQVETHGGTEELGEVGGDGGDFGGDPEKEADGTREMFAAVLREGEAGDDAQLGREVLDEDRHGVRPEQDPEKTVAELGSAEDVGGEVAGIDVGDGGDEGGSEVGPHLVAAEVREEMGSGGDGLVARSAIGFGKGGKRPLICTDEHGSGTVQVRQI